MGTEVFSRYGYTVRIYTFDGISYMVEGVGLRDPSRDRWEDVGSNGHKLSMRGSGTSGAILLRTTCHKHEEKISLVIGVHNNSLWWGMMLKAPSLSAETLVGLYYGGGGAPWDYLQDNSTQPQRSDCRAVDVTFRPSYNDIEHGEIEVKISSSEERIGMYVLHTPKDTRLDIVFVHGLNGHPYGTWTYCGAGSRVFWPQELLPADIPFARVMTWGYDAALDISEPCLETIQGHANSLLKDLSAERSGLDKSKTIPQIIFIGHNVGGIIIKKALQDSSSGGSKEKDIYESTIGVVFLGTPHRGVTDSSILTESPESGAKASPLLDAMRSDRSYLIEMIPIFSRISDKMFLICAYEKQKGTITVASSSAIMDGSGVTQVSMEAGHEDMCRIRSKDNVGYKRLLFDIQQSLKARNPSLYSVA